MICPAGASNLVHFERRKSGVRASYFLWQLKDTKFEWPILLYAFIFHIHKLSEASIQAWHIELSLLRMIAWILILCASIFHRKGNRTVGVWVKNLCGSFRNRLDILQQLSSRGISQLSYILSLKIAVEKVGSEKISMLLANLII